MVNTPSSSPQAAKKRKVDTVMAAGEGNLLALAPSSQAQEITMEPGSDGEHYVYFLSSDKKQIGILECHVQSGSPQLRAELKNSKTASEGSCQVWEVDFPSGTIDALVKFFDGVPIDQVVSNALQLRSLHDFANAYGFDGLGRVLDAHARHELLNKDPLGVFAFAISDDKELELAKKACLKLGEQYELCKTSDPVLQATWDAATIFQDQQEYVACVWREKKPNGKGGASSEAAGQHDAFLLLAQTGLQNMTGGRIFAAVFEACRRVEALFGTNNIACDSTIKSRRIPDAEISILDQSLGRLCWSCVEDELEASKEIHDPWM